MLRSFIAVALAALAMGTVRAQDDPANRMRAMSRALGVECTHCHAAADFARDQTQQFAFANRMTKMTAGLSAGTLRDLGGVTCWTCHRGNVKPERMPRAGWEERLAGWPESLKLGPEDAKKPGREVWKNLQSMADSRPALFP